MALTFSPDPPHLLAGAGTAAQQSARPRLVADHVNGGWDPAPITATGAIAGTPGTWTPTGATVPADLTALQAGIVANPATLWTVGQYVVTFDLQEAFWDGAAWMAGRAPAAVARIGKESKAT